MNIRKNPATSITELIDYELFYGLKEPNTEATIKSISVQEFEQWQTQNQDFQLIDVREAYEYDIVNLKGELIPLSAVVEQQHKINPTKPVVIHCRSGKRSAEAIQLLEKLGFKNLYNLEGGILAYAKEIDTTMPVY